MPIERYQINAGDTLQQIARRQLGNADQWWILANFNKLDYPFIDTTETVYPSQRVLGLGDILLIVKDTNDPSVKRAILTDSPDQFRLLLGVDMALEPGADLQADPATGDWQTVQGLDNLIDALYRRLSTKTGIYPYHPEYGSNLEQYVGQAGDPVVATAIRLEAIQTLLNEPRIREVVKIALNADQGGRVSVDTLSTIIGSDSTTTLNFVIAR